MIDTTVTVTNAITIKNIGNHKSLSEDALLSNFTNFLKLNTKVEITTSVSRNPIKYWKMAGKKVTLSPEIKKYLNINVANKTITIISKFNLPIKEHLPF